MRAGEPVLSVENLRVDYGDVTAVDDMSFEIGPGQIFGLVGPNGAGKTSCIRVVATLMEPTYGRVKVCGYDVLETPSLARRHIGYMPDLAPVNPDLRIEEFLEFFDRSYGLPPAGRRERIEAAIAEVGLDSKRKTFARNLSRGLTQRLVLAKTLLHQPSLLLLDEPASGMDPLARRELREILRTQISLGRSVLISSHILTELADMCTHVGVMRGGHLRAVGSVQQIIALADQTVRAVVVELIGRAQDLAGWLSGRSDVDSVRIHEQRLEFRLHGDDAAAAALLAAMVSEGFPVMHYAPGRARLEDVLTSLSRHGGDAT